MLKFTPVFLAILFLLTACGNSSDENEDALPHEPAVEDESEANKKPEIPAELLPFLSNKFCNVNFRSTIYSSMRFGNEERFVENNVTLKLLSNGLFNIEINKNTESDLNYGLPRNTLQYLYRTGTWSADGTDGVSLQISESHSLTLTKGRFEDGALGFEISGEVLNQMDLPEVLMLRADEKTCIEPLIENEAIRPEIFPEVPILKKEIPTDYFN